MTATPAPVGFEKQEVGTVNYDHDPAFEGAVCPVCRAAVILHCDKCKVQVSSCVCLVREQLKVEYTPEEMAEMEAASAKDRLRQKGMIV